MFKKILLLLLLSTAAFSQTALPLVPQPKSIVMNTGYFVLDKGVTIQQQGSDFEANFLKEYLQKQYNLNLKNSKPKDIRRIVFQLVMPDTTAISREKYQLTVTKDVVYITASDNQGIFYGLQTFLQLLPTDRITLLKVPCLQILDEPKFQYRGMHLDVVRHFFPASFVKKYIDYLAMYKMNTFHWHLTDDQGWRIEIKSRPKLTTVGAFRKGTMVGPYNDNKYDNVRYGGFYTQNEIKDIIAYAKERHITIIPEIEMPGHALAALSAYPELACTKGPFEAAKGWGVFDDVFCPKEETFSFLTDVLTEVMELFPSEYLHIGGDECPKTRWKTCPNCQALMQKERLKDEHELQSYFIRRIEKLVNGHGKKIIGWDEILEGGLAPNAAVMSWRGIDGGIAAAKQQHYVVMTPTSHCYFDQYQGDPKTEPIAFGGNITLEKVYGFNPIPAALNQEEAKYILGAQANLWTEYIETPEKVEYMIFPRMMALAEVVWGTSNPENYTNFKNRVTLQLPLLDKLGIKYSKTFLNQ